MRDGAALLLGLGLGFLKFRLGSTLLERNLYTEKKKISKGGLLLEYCGRPERHQTGRKDLDGVQAGNCLT